MSHNIKFIATVILIFSLVVAVLIKSKVKDTGYSVQSVGAVAGGKLYKIAIMVPATHPALEEIQDGFLKSLDGVIAYKHDLYNANGDRTLMRHQAEEIVAKDYDLVFTIATGPGLIMKEVSEQRGKVIPIVAGAVDSPVDIKMIASMQSSGNNVTVVTGTDDFDQQIDMLRYLKSDLKSILLVYNAVPGLEKKRKKVEQICNRVGVDFQAVEIFNISDLIQKVPTFIHAHDTVMVLKDNMVVSGIESLINLCNKNGKTLYASDLNSGDKGAALSYGIHEYDDGVESAKKAIEILKDGKKPSEIPSSMNMQFKIKVNTKTMQQQGLDLPEELLVAMKSGEVI